MAQFYGVSCRAEAKAYLADAELGPRLVELNEIVAASACASAREMFGSPDDVKLCSSATLFASLEEAPPVFARVLDRYFGGEPDARTLALLD